MKFITADRVEWSRAGLIELARMYADPLELFQLTC
ncbi:hypothetical protein EDD64_11644 [Effusibacillus lacus]|nr:hypothetical protein EDD64_11644 [Effusibacillus lacus]